MKLPEDSIYESLASVPDRKVKRPSAKKPARTGSAAKPEFKIGNADNGRRDRKRADAKLKRFD
jgi:hypothetical protein